MLHEPGPDSLTAAERAVDYARLVGAEEIELSARLTLGGLLVDSGAIETGLATMQAALTRTTELGLVADACRAHTNLMSNLTWSPSAVPPRPSMSGPPGSLWRESTACGTTRPGSGAT